MILELLMALTLYITQASQLSASSALISPVPLESSEPATASASPLSSPTSTSAVLSATIDHSSPSVSPTPTPTNSPTSKPAVTPTIKPSSISTITDTAIPSSTPSSTPKPTNKPSPSATSTERPKTKEITGPEMDALFTKYSDQYKVDREQLRRIAICESKLNINALNKAYGYGGLYQFSVATWKSYRKLIGQDPNPDLRFEPEEAIETAAWMLSTGRSGAWPNCK